MCVGFGFIVRYVSTLFGRLRGDLGFILIKNFLLLSIHLCLIFFFSRVRNPGLSDTTWDRETLTTVARIVAHRVTVAGILLLRPVWVK